MVEITMKKGETLKITVEGMEGYPLEVPFDDVVQVVAQSLSNKISKEKYERDVAVQRAIAQVNMAQATQSGLIGPDPLNNLTRN